SFIGRAGKNRQCCGVSCRMALSSDGTATSRDRTPEATIRVPRTGSNPRKGRGTMSRDFPHDSEAEQVLLGYCLLGESASPLCGLDPTLFYSSANRQVAAEILALADAGEP